MPAASTDVVYPRSMVFGDPALPVYTATTVLNADHDQHSHDFVETAFVRSGTGTHVTVSGRQRLRAGSAVVVRPGGWHGYVSCRDLVVTNCCFGSELFARELAWLRTDPVMSELLWAAPTRPDRHGVYTGQLSRRRLDRCEEATAGLQTALTEPQGRRRAAAIGWLVVFLGELATLLGEAPAVTGAGTPEVVVRSLALLDEQVSRAWTVTELAAHVHVGPSHLTRLFTAHVGVPPMRYLARARVERAAALLADTDRPISSVGADVGWADPNYFSRAFRAAVGLSPSSYRSRQPSRSPVDHPSPGRRP